MLLLLLLPLARGCCSPFHQLVTDTTWQSFLVSSLVGRFSPACCCGLGQSGVVAALTVLSFTTEEGEGTKMHPYTSLTTCILSVFHFFPCIFSRPLHGSSDCNYLYLFSALPFTRLCVFATVACCSMQPDQMLLPKCSNCRAAAQTTALVYF